MTQQESVVVFRVVVPGLASYLRRLADKLKQEGYTQAAADTRQFADMLTDESTPQRVKHLAVDAYVNAQVVASSED